jgi:hypothetical protein
MLPTYPEDTLKSYLELVDHLFFLMTNTNHRNRGDLPKERVEYWAIGPYFAHVKERYKGKCNL